MNSGESPCTLESAIWTQGYNHGYLFPSWSQSIPAEQSNKAGPVMTSVTHKRDWLDATLSVSPAPARPCISPEPDI